MCAFEKVHVYCMQVLKSQVCYTQRKSSVNIEQYNRNTLKSKMVHIKNGQFVSIFMHKYLRVKGDFPGNCMRN